MSSNSLLFSALQNMPWFVSSMVCVLTDHLSLPIISTNQVLYLYIPTSFRSVRTQTEVLKYWFVKTGTKALSE